MIIAVTTEDGQVYQHFGKSESFYLYTVENERISDIELLDARQSGHSALAGLLYHSAVNVLICGGIGAGARRMLESANIKVVAGTEGSVEAAVSAFLKGQINDMGSTCKHHDHDQWHECACHDHCN